MTVKRQILEFVNEELELDINRGEIREFERSLNAENDFYVEIYGNEYRVINADVIKEIYIEEIKNTTEDCYNIQAPSWLAIDWEQTAENCLVDGYGHTFSSYDGSELEYTFGDENYYIFRIN